MQEAGMRLLSHTEASARIAYDKAREILDCGHDPLLHIKFFYQLWVKADYPSELTALGCMDDEVYLARGCYGQDEKEDFKMVRGVLSDFIQDFETGDGKRADGDPKY